MDLKELVSTELSLLDNKEEEKEIISLIGIGRLVIKQVSKEHKEEVYKLLNEYAFIDTKHKDEVVDTLIYALDNFNLVKYFEYYNKLDKSIKGFEFSKGETYITLSIYKFKEFLNELNKLLA